MAPRLEDGRSSVQRNLIIPPRGASYAANLILYGRGYDLFCAPFGGINERYPLSRIAGMPTPFSATELLAELPRLRRYARILTGDAERADGLVEETLRRARHMQEDSFCASSRHTQLLALLRSVSAEHTSPAMRCEIASTQPSAGYPTSPADPGENPRRPASDHGAHMLAQLHDLPLEQREVLVLVAVERMSYADIAALLHIPAATVISRLSQAREALRAIPPYSLSAPNSGS